MSFHGWVHSLSNQIFRLALSLPWLREALCPSPLPWFYAPPPPAVSEVREPSSCLLAGVCHVGPVCLWAVFLCGGSQVIWYHGSAVLWDRHVPLHPLQPQSCHTGHCTTDHEDRVLHGRYVCVCVCLCTSFRAGTYVCVLSVYTSWHIMIVCVCVCLSVMSCCHGCVYTGISM